jgi:hypothetical protein
LKPKPRTLPAASAALALLIATSGGLAQSPAGGAETPARAQPAVDPLDITGRTFSGLRLPLAATRGAIELRAQRAYTWTETEPTSPQPVQRVFLSGDVTLRLGMYSFPARRASLWLQRVEDAGPDVWQVFAFIDGSSAPVGVSAITIEGDRLPVQGLIVAPEGVQLAADRHFQGRPQDRFLTEAEGALAARLRRLVSPPPPAIRPDDLLRRGERVPPISPLGETDEQVLARERQEIARLERRLEPAYRDEPIFSESGVIALSAGDIRAVTDEGERALIVSGGITVAYTERRPLPADDRSMQITAHRGVVFLGAGADNNALSWTAVDVRGVYLEGDVQAQIVTPEGRYTIRSPRVYYDVASQRGLLVDAVFSTVDPQRGIPLYVRARTISQLSANTFRATGARVTNTPFLEPDLSIGASSVTIRQLPASGARDRRLNVDARDITLRAGDVPFFWWPRIEGDPSQFPLRELRLENASSSGAALKTTWNAYTLLGIDPPGGTGASLIVDGYFERGPALGGEFSWRGLDYRGSVFGYSVLNDTGRDQLATGARRNVDGEFRGMVLAEHISRLNEQWTVFAEGAYISDPTFVDAFFDPLHRSRREFTNSLYAQRIKDNTLLFGELRGNANDFISNQYLLQSPGYGVTRLPDIGYARFADDVLKEYPGLLSYSSEYRFTHMRLELPDPEVRRLGFTSLGRSRSLFGISPDQSIADALRAQGYSEDWVSRFDTRQELAMPLAAGPVNVTPFVVGRFTGYDESFDSYSPDADDSYRLWGAAGVTLSTEIHRVDNSVHSRLFDLHRIRHIISPSVTLWHAGSTIDRVDLPEYDRAVEGIAEGSAARIGINQTWQTQRGGPGRWRSVDVFTLNAELIFASDDVDQQGPLNRYFSYRPEYSVLGNTFANVEATWQVSEVFALAAQEVYDFELNQSQRTNVGAVLQHTPEFSSFAELRFINPQNQTYALFGVSYDLTQKYALSTTANYDTTTGEVQAINTQIRRRFPSVVLGVGIGYNNITNETSFGFIVQPFALERFGANIRTFGGDQGGFGIGG